MATSILFGRRTGFGSVRASPTLFLHGGLLPPKTPAPPLCRLLVLEAQKIYLCAPQAPCESGYHPPCALWQDHPDAAIMKTLAERSSRSTNS